MSEKNKEERNGMAITARAGLPSDVKKAGVLRKLKTMKKKYFVLRKESDNGPARLEYYDSEKKFRSGLAPKRSIIIKKCFNINRKVDAKQKLAIALYTKDDCFSVVAETEQLLEEWLKAMLELQLDGTTINGGAALKPKFEHVWQVTIGEKSLACTRSLRGLHRLCLTNTSLTLVKMDQSDNPETVEFPLMSIRRCGHSNNYFLIELGRSSITGAGELWLETEDVVIAQNMHEVTLNAMKSCRELEDMGSYRPRSASNTETSRPITTRRPVAVVSAQPNPYPSVRDRCDSMPSRPRTISEGQEVSNRSYYASPNHPVDSLRSHSSFPRTVSYSPPGISNPLSPCSTACSTDSAGSSLSIDEYDGVSGQADFSHGRYSHNMPTDNAILIEPPIKEEQLDDYLPMCVKGPKETTSGYMHMSAGSPYSSSAPSGPSLYLNLIPSESPRSSIPTTVVSTSKSSEYVEMTSPSSPPGDYLPMSPLSTKVTAANDGNKDMVPSTTSMSSSPKLPPEGYLYMAPVVSASTSHTEGYLDMAPLSSSLPKTGVLSGSADRFNFQTSNCASDTSVNSSTDASKSEVYRLDKVKSLLTDTDDTSDDYIRPVRAYSMGSRPQPKKTHLSIHNEGSRIRAYSVGSQAVSKRNKLLNSADHDFGSLKRVDIRASAKSSSAPLLHSRPPRLRSSTSRGDVGEDLMEIDYNKLRHLNTGMSLRDSEFTIEPVGRNRSGSYSSGGSSFSGKIDRYSRPLHDRDKINLHSSFHNSQSAADSVSGYMSMSPVSWTSTKSSNVTASPSVQIRPVEHVVHPAGDYVSLNPACRYPPVTSVVLPSVNLPVNAGLYGKAVDPVSSSQPSNATSTVHPALYSQYTVCNSERLPTESNKVLNHEAGSSSPNSSCAVSINLPDGVPKIRSNEKLDTSPSDTSDYLCMDFVKTENNLSKTDSIAYNGCMPELIVNSSVDSNHQNVIEEHVNISSSVSCNDMDVKGSGECVVDQNVSSTVGAVPKKNDSEQLISVLDKSNLTSSLENVFSNYASLDSSPVTCSAEDDGSLTMIMPVHRARLPPAASSETKEVPLTYAEIDFSSVPDAALKNHRDNNLSHL